MSRLPLLILIVVAAAVVGACSATPATWTFEPAPPSTPAPSVAPSASGSSGSASASAPTSSGGSESPAASGGGAGATVELTAQNIQFDKTDLEAPAGQAFAIKFSNQDAGVPHNVAIKDASGADVFKGEIVTGPTETTYQVPALQAGTYTFYCSVHPNMTGTVTVK